MTAFPKLLLGMLAGVLLTACTDEARGPIERQTRTVGSFSAIDVEGAGVLDITVGQDPTVEIEAPAEVLEHMKTEVRDGTLYIRSKAKHWGRGRTQLKVSVPTLSSLQLRGGNDVSVHGFAGGESSIKAEGAVNIEAQGELDRLTIRMAGASNGDFSKLVAADTHVTVDGIGSVVVHPKEKLDATMNGVGAIHYTGTPREVRTRMNGLGRIGKTDEAAAPETSDEKVEIDPDTLQPEYEDEEPRSGGQLI